MNTGFSLGTKTNARLEPFLAEAEILQGPDAGLSFLDSLPA